MLSVYNVQRMRCFERNSIRFFGGVYAAALLALVIAGMTAPDLFVKKSQEMITPTPGLSSPKSSYIFDMTDYKVPVKATRANSHCGRAWNGRYCVAELESR